MAAAMQWSRAFWQSLSRFDPLSVGIVVSLLFHVGFMMIRFSAAA